MKQHDHFLNGLADAWWERNAAQLERLEHQRRIDPVIAALRVLELQPATVMEIGCSNGWRLACLSEDYPGIDCFGIDPSRAAIAAGNASFPGLALQIGTSNDLPIPDSSIDLLIYGFCLYLCDRTELFNTAAEADRVLSEGGYIVIYDFESTIPQRRPYANHAGLYTYKMDYTRLFSWNPSYRCVYHRVVPHPGTGSERAGDRLQVAVLRRDYTNAYADITPPVSP